MKKLETFAKEIILDFNKKLSVYDTAYVVGFYNYNEEYMVITVNCIEDNQFLYIERVLTDFKSVLSKKRTLRLFDTYLSYEVLFDEIVLKLVIYRA